MSVNTLQEKFLDQLPFLYFSENQFVSAQQKMLSQATDPTLKAGLQKHMEQTKQHASNLEQVFGLMGRKPQEKECPICMGLIKSGTTGMQEAGNDAVRDASIGGSAALIEHYEIGAYRGMVAQAQAMGNSEVVQLLQHNLQEEEQTAQQLEGAAPTLLQKVSA